MGNEPDEEQQIVHLLLYANEIDIEGLIAVTGKFLRRDPRPDLFLRLIAGYAQVEKSLRRHAEGWPTADDLRSVVAAGQDSYGIAATGPGKSTAGSKLIIAAAERDDPRPLHVVVNAGANTLAQALLDYRDSHSPEETSRLVRKLRVFENGSQDNAGAWILHEFPELHWIRSNYQTYCYGGPVFDGKPNDKGQLGPYAWEPFAYSSVGQHHWALEHVIANHGALGGLYPLRLFHRGEMWYLEGGGTIPWMGLVHKGVYHPDHPHWGSFSGRFSKTKLTNYWSRHDDIRADERRYGEFRAFGEAADRWTNPETGETYDNEYAPVWRWRRAMFNDFRARMDWCVTTQDKANHNPQAVIDGDGSNEIVYRTVDAGRHIAIDASHSRDPDGDALSFRWFTYPEAGTYQGETDLANDRSSQVTLSAPDQPGELHLIVEVVDDDKQCPLYCYRRVVVQVERRER